MIILTSLNKLIPRPPCQLVLFQRPLPYNIIVYISAQGIYPGQADRSFSLLINGLHTRLHCHPNSLKQLSLASRRRHRYSKINTTFISRCSLSPPDRRLWHVCNSPCPVRIRQPVVSKTRRNSRSVFYAHVPCLPC